MSVYLRKELSRPVWYFRICIDGKRYNRPVPEATSLREAEKAETVFKSNLLQGKYELADKQGSMLFKELVNDYESYAKTTKKSWETEQCRVNKLREYFGDKRLKDITPIAVERYRHDRKQTPKVRQKKHKGKPPAVPKLIANASVNREVAILRKMFSIAVENGWIDKNPCLAKTVKPLRENSHRERYLTPEEELSLLTACAGDSEYLKPILTCALHTGMRKSEILNLKWQCVDLDKGYVTVTKTKSGKDRNIPLSPSLKRMLKELQASSKSDYVFANPLTCLPYVDVKRCYERVCQKAKINGLRFHDLRHTAATRMVSAGIDLAVVQDILGHASLSTTQRYAHPVPERKLQAVLALDSYVANHEKQKQSSKVVNINTH